MNFDMVIGLETHIELSTKTKIFCGCTTQFGGDANTHCCPVCIGLPGALPKLNRAVVEYASKAGMATNCEISNFSKMDRKNYVYPDLAKAYQISQFDYPLCRNGHITLSDGHTIRINRIHIEEDAGKLVHQGGDTLVDYNRGGVPLIEIVTEPDFQNAQQVKEYLETLRLIMKTIDVSDCKMQEGSMRCDVNISIKEKGSDKLGTRAEIKNVNSFTFVTKAIEAEFERQADIIENGGEVIQETRRYNSETDETESMRDKEDSNDYRYFREPDLPYVHITDERLEELRKEIGELPMQKKQRYIEEFKLSETDAAQIVKYPKLTRYFEEMVELSGGEVKLCANILFTHIFRFMADEEAKENADLPISAKDVAYVVKMIATGEISNNFTKKIIDAMFENGESFDNLFDKNEFKAADNSEIMPIVEKVIANNPKAVEDFRGGKTKAIGSLIGMVMRETKGKADAKSVEAMIVEKLK